MVDWQDPQMIKNCSSAFVDVTFLILGLYGWEHLHSYHVEKALLRRQLSFQWQMLAYLIGRIFFLVTVTLSAVLSVAVVPHIDCDCVLKFLAFSGNVVVACASANLVIRTWAIWRSNRSVCLLLALVTLGHWFTLTLDSKDMQVSSSSSLCGFLVVNPTYSAATSMYTMIFDLLLLILTIVGLSHSSPSSLWATLRSQGVIYFFITFLASIVPLIFSWMNLNYMMNIFFACPAACIMTMASSRAVTPTFNTPRRTPVGGTTELGKERVRITTRVVLSESPALGLV